MFQGITYTGHAHPFPAQMRQGTQIGYGVLAPVGVSQHADTSRAAIHLVELPGEFHRFIVFG